ncbi:MAG: hypothetical protein J7621_14590 [Niastella sp.]|nr:hypothetical protein [Niastella sp.]
MTQLRNLTLLSFLGLVFISCSHKTRADQPEQPAKTPTGEVITVNVDPEGVINIYLGFQF